MAKYRKKSGSYRGSRRSSGRSRSRSNRGGAMRARQQTVRLVVETVGASTPNGALPLGVMQGAPPRTRSF